MMPTKTVLIIFLECIYYAKRSYMHSVRNSWVCILGDYTARDLGTDIDHMQWE